MFRSVVTAHDHLGNGGQIHFIAFPEYWAELFSDVIRTCYAYLMRCPLRYGRSEHHSGGVVVVDIGMKLGSLYFPWNWTRELQWSLHVCWCWESQLDLRLVVLHLKDQRSRKSECYDRWRPTPVISRLLTGNL